MDFLTNPFTTALLFLYQLLNQNIFLTIVGFTVVIRLLLLPLTYQQLKSTKAMQAVQPKMKEIQEKYKGDREKLARAQMELYQQNGVNPLAGCLPLAVQFPILIGLYGAISRALSASPLQLLDLSHRILIPGLSNLVPLQNHFFIWDLAAPDHSYILVVLVVASTWLSQKLLTPPQMNSNGKDAGAAMSRNMLLMMPLMMGVFTLNVASGVAIYWIFGGLAVILQYVALGRIDVRSVLPGFLANRMQPAGGAPVEIPSPAPVAQTNRTITSGGNGNGSVRAIPGKIPEKTSGSANGSKGSSKLAPNGSKAKSGSSGSSKSASAKPMATVESNGKPRKVSLSGPAGKPAARVIDEPDVPIAAVPRKIKPTDKPKNK